MRGSHPATIVWKHLGGRRQALGCGEASSEDGICLHEGMRGHDQGFAVVEAALRLPHDASMVFVLR